jgi:hypothetical protein
MFRRQRLWLVALAVSLVATGAGAAWAQDDDDDMTFEPDDVSKPKDGEPEPEPGTEPGTEPAPEPEPEPTIDESAAKATPEEKLGEKRVSWQDIVVVVRKPFTTAEGFAHLGATMNTTHPARSPNGQLNYYLTDVLAVGVEGGSSEPARRSTWSPARRRLPTVNKYNYAAALNFHYVPAR